MAERTRITLFLGAGSSKAFGFPTTAELLPTIRDRLYEGSLFSTYGRGERGSEHRSMLKAFLEGLVPNFRKRKGTSLPMVTEILSLLDHALVTSSAIVVAPPRVRMPQLRRLVERAIYEALDWNVAYNKVPTALNQFITWLKSTYDDDDVDVEVGIISTNYDTVVEYFLFSERHLDPLRCDFGFAWRDVDSGEVISRPRKPDFSIYRLHGAINWVLCPLCAHIYVNHDGSIIEQGFREENDIDSGNTCHCGYAPLEPILVAPSLVRDIRDSTLLEVWRHALEFMRTSDRWFIVGYSLPLEDVAIRSLFLRARTGWHRYGMPEIVVVQRALDPAMLSRYDVLFPGCKYSKAGMAGFAAKLPNLDAFVKSARVLSS